jgi:predicted nuclease with RNAse H fold
MAVPLRAQLLAEHAAPIVGTVLETHPRATLLLELGIESLENVKDYKRSPESVAKLSRLWVERFQIRGELRIPTHDALDAVVCATVAHVYHSDPARIRQLHHHAKDRRGRGPFVVLDRSLVGARDV